MAPPSALFGRPPLTDDDYWIVKSLQRSMIARLQASGQLKGSAPPLQPEKGLKLPLPSHLPDEYRGPNYVAAATTSIVLIVLVTGLRLSIRARNPKQHWGKDDWAMLLALVRPFISSYYQLLLPERFTETFIAATIIGPRYSGARER